MKISKKKRANQTAREVLAEWISLQRSTEPTDDADRSLAQDLALSLYDARKHRRPSTGRVVWSSSPFVALVGAGLSALCWAGKRQCRELPSREDDVRTHSLRHLVDFRRCRELPSREDDVRRLDDLLFDVKTSHVLAVKVDVYQYLVRAAGRLRPLVEVPVQVAADLLGGIIDSEGTLGDILKAKIATPVVLEQLCRVVRECAGDDALDMVPTKLRDDLGTEHAVEIVGRVMDTVEPGNLQPAVPAAVEYLSRVGTRETRRPVDTEALIRSNLAKLSGPWAMHSEFLILSERPDVLTTDEAGALHATEGPACRWRDGTRIYALHGVRVKSSFVERPQDETAESLDGLSLNERRVCLTQISRGEQVMSAIYDIRERVDGDL